MSSKKKNRRLPFFAIHRGIGVRVHTLARRVSIVPFSYDERRGFLWNKRVGPATRWSGWLWDSLELL